MFRLKDLNTTFENQIAVEYLQEFNYRLPYEIGDPHLLEVPHNIDRESKLYHSNFYTYKLAYDSFAAQIALERFKTNLATPPIAIRFKPSNTINSNMMFKWDCPSSSSYKKVSDYEEFISATRNNEKSLYNNDYVNYIRTGYNYDRKIKNWSLGSSAANAVLGTGSNLASTAINRHIAKITSGATKAASLATVGAWIGFGAGTVAALLGGVVSWIQQETQWESKLAQLKAQSTSVSGSDDIDLLNWYNGNKLHIITYKASDRTCELVYDLFRYTGYATNIQKKPDLQTRCWYNFIQCEAKFNNEEDNVLKPFIDDIKARFSAGITNYHMNILPSTGAYTWDWDQEYENFEVSLING